MTGDAPARARDLADLAADLREAGFAAGVSETVDATQLLLALARRSREIDAVRLRSMLRPVFCKSEEQQEQFDAIFDRWWHQTAAAPPSPPPLSLSPPALSDAPSPTKSRVVPAVAILLLIAVTAAILYFGREEPAVPPQNETRSAPVPESPAPVGAGGAAGTGAAAPRRASVVDRYVPAARRNVELRPWWIWLLAALPLAGLLGATVPALVLSRTTLRRRGEPMFLDPSQLIADARRLVPPLPSDIGDRMARHVRSRGIDIERLARRPSLDVRRTIEATLRNRGIPTLRFSVARVQPSYLVLVDLVHERDPRGRLFYQWAERLAREGLIVELRRLRRQREREGGAAVAMYAPFSEDDWRPLSQLPTPRFGERLIVMTDGDVFIDADGAWRPDAARAELYRWRDRAIFTPVEPRDWGDREDELERAERSVDPGFIVLPLEETALRAWTDLVATGQLSTVTLSDPQRFPALLRRGGGAEFLLDDPPPVETLERLVQQLRIYLGEQGFYWLAAMAVAPLVRWETTLLLGKAVLATLPRLGSERSLNAALARNYRRLVRLPWLQRETMPDWLRLRLLLELSQTQRDETRAIVAQTLAKLSPRPVADGIELDFERPPGTEVDRRYVRGEPAPDRAAADALYLGYMDGLSPEQLLMRVPRQWGAWAKRIPLRRPRGWRGWWARLRDRAQVTWARWAWTEGLPHLGVNRWRVAVCGLLLLPAIGTGGVAVWWAPQSPVAPGWFFTEKTHPQTLDLGEVPTAVAFSQPLAVRVRNLLVEQLGVDYAELADDASLGSDLSADDVDRGEIERALGQTFGGTFDGMIGADARLSDVIALVQRVMPSSGMRVAAGYADGSVRVWDVETRAELLLERRTHAGGVSSIAVSGDGHIVVSGGVEGAIRLRTVGVGTVTPRQLAGVETDGVRVIGYGSAEALALSADGLTLATAGVDRRILIRDLSASDAPTTDVVTHTADVTALAMDSRSTVIAGDKNGVVTRWSETDTPSEGRRRVEMGERHSGWVISLAVAPSETVVVSGGADGTIHVNDLGTGRVASITAASAPITGLAVHALGGRLLAATRTGALQLWDLGSRRQIGPQMGGGQTGATTAAFRDDGDGFVAALSNRLEFWTPFPFVPGPSIPSTRVSALALTPDGRRVVAGLDAGQEQQVLQVWDTQNQRLVASLGDSSTAATSVAVSPDSRTAVVADMSGVLTRWDLSTGRMVDQQSQVGAYTSVAYSPDGRMFVSGGRDAVVRLWDADTGQSTGSEKLGAVPIRLVFAPDGRRIVALMENGRLALLPLNGSSFEAPSAIRSLEPYTAVAFSPNGQRLVAGDRQGRLHTYDGTTVLPRLSFPAQPTAVFDVDFTRTGAVVSVSTPEDFVEDAAGGQFRTPAMLLVVDPETGQPIGSPLTLPGNPSAMALNRATDQLALAYSYFVPTDKSQAQQSQAAQSQAAPTQAVPGPVDTGLRQVIAISRFSVAEPASAGRVTSVYERSVAAGAAMSGWWLIGVLTTGWIAGVMVHNVRVRRAIPAAAVNR